MTKKVERPNQHIMADDFGISELVTLAPGFDGSAPRCGSGKMFTSNFNVCYISLKESLHIRCVYSRFENIGLKLEI